MMNLIAYRITNAAGEHRTIIAGVLTGVDSLDLLDDNAVVISGDAAFVSDTLDGSEWSTDIEVSPAVKEAIHDILVGLRLEEP